MHQLPHIAAATRATALCSLTTLCKRRTGYADQAASRHTSGLAVSLTAWPLPPRIADSALLVPLVAELHHHALAGPERTSSRQMSAFFGPVTWQALVSGMLSF